MNKTQENKLSMYYAVQEVCHAHQTVWGNLAAFTNTFTAFETNVTGIEGLLQVQKTSIKGITADKEAAKTEMMNQGLKMAHALYAFASNTNNLILKGKMEFSRGKLQRVRDSIILQHCRTIKDEAQANIASLTDYGITAAVLTDFQTKIVKSALVIASPRSAIVERKGAGNELNKLMHSNDVLLKDQLDKLAESFRTANAEFYQLYQDARAIVDLGIRHKTPASVIVPPAPMQ
ncbi:MAG: hypothetical protein ABI199_09370 [Bacteroidia bacterium]